MEDNTKKSEEINSRLRDSKSQIEDKKKEVQAAVSKLKEMFIPLEKKELVIDNTRVVAVLMTSGAVEFLQRARK